MPLCLNDAPARSSTVDKVAHLRRNTIGGVVGNVLEWYDFAVFGFFAPVIGNQFFPSQDRFASLLCAFGVFAGAYLARPLGGMLFGHIGDLMGRKKALQISVLMMAISTTLVGLLPTHSAVGVAAPILLVLLRLVQGLSVGGELVGSISFIAEIAPPSRRGLFGSLALCGVTAGIMLGSAVAVAAHSLLDTAALEAWGWRIPFLAGIGVGAFGLWMRRGMVETPHFEQAVLDGDFSHNPVAEVIRMMPGRLLHVAALVVLEAGGFYMLFVWWPTFLTDILRPPVQHALLINMISMLLLTALIPVAGWLSDTVGRGLVLGIASAGIAVAVYPLFLLTTSGSFAAVLAAQLVFAVLMSGVAGPLPSMMAEMFPTRNRFSGIAVAYNIPMAVFGGTAPLVCTWLVIYTGNVFAPAYYLICLAIITAVAAVLDRPQAFLAGRARLGKRRAAVIYPPPPSRPVVESHENATWRVPVPSGELAGAARKADPR